jgi:HNH endonuclease
MKTIQLTNSDKVVIVDDEDFGRLNQHKWRIDTKGYARRGTRIGGRTGPYVTIRLHHEVIGKPPEGYVTDHINRNKLDDRRENLRFVTPSESEHNKDLQKNNSSGYRGVVFRKATGKFIAQIGEQHIGCYDTIEEASIAYKKMLWWKRNGS